MEEEDTRSPAELLRKLIFYAQFHDPPDQSAPGPRDDWDFAALGIDRQVNADCTCLIPALVHRKCEPTRSLMQFLPEQRRMLAPVCLAGLQD